MTAVTGAHVMMACIEATNAPSVTLQAGHGFELVGAAWEVGHKFGRWFDLTMMSLTRMSPAPDEPGPGLNLTPGCPDAG